MADLISDDTPVAAFAHLARVAYLGPRLRNRMIFGCVPILRQIRQKNRSGGGYRYQTSGRAAVYLRLLRDPRTRTLLLRISRISPEKFVSPEKFGSDEDIARMMALASIINDLEKRFDDEFYKHLPRFFHESHKVHALHMLGDDHDDDTTRHIDMALDRLETAINAVVDDAVNYAGRCLARDFGGLRAPQLVAKLVNHTFGLRPELNERQVRYLCGWG